MSLYDSKIYLNDLDRIIEEYDSIIEMLDNTSILITGATGMICSALIDVIFRADKKYNRNIHVYVAGRNEKSAKNRFLQYSGEQYYHFVPYDARIRNEFSFHVDYIIHGASNSSPADIEKNGIDTMIGNFYGLYELLLYADREKAINTLYISSSEIYGKKDTTGLFNENEYGWVDILNPRSSYPSSKRAAETLCACFFSEHNQKTTIVRPGHVYGPTGKRKDSHVSSVFAYAAADGNNLVMKSSGSQIRSWCYVLDAASAILTVLAKGKGSNAYNISDKMSVMSIKDMAELLAKKEGVKLIFDISGDKKKAGNVMDNSALDASKLQNLGWKNVFSVAEGFGHTIKIIREAGI